ncbi:PLP-dependent aminotransferase family protein, partial [Rhizobiaceae sp. 2RAB30]
VSCPPHFTHRVAVAHKMATGGMSFVLAELSARLVLSGEAEGLRERCLQEINARLKLARSILSGFDLNTQPNIPFVWLGLPDPWLSGTFAKAAFDTGILLDDEDEFKAGRSEQVYHRVRLGLSTPRNRDEVTAGLEALRRLLDDGRSGYDTYG